MNVYDDAEIWHKLRNFLIRLIAGNKMVILNARVCMHKKKKEDEHGVYVQYADRPFLMNSDFEAACPFKFVIEPYDKKQKAAMKRLFKK